MDLLKLDRFFPLALFIGAWDVKVLFASCNLFALNQAILFDRKYIFEGIKIDR
jgi:hypothetical protein